MAIINQNTDDSIKPQKINLCKKKKVLEAINVLKQLNQKFFEGETKKPLLDETSENPVFLQITLKKIPNKSMTQHFRVNLPHSLLTDTMEVCLITGDLEKRNHKAEIEPVALHYKELLKKHDVTKITEVISLRQLRTEYKGFEAKRQLVGAYDMFLTDRKIAQCLPRLLGKTFFSKRKMPIQINMASSNLKEQIDNAVSKSNFSLTCRGNNCCFEVAQLNMNDTEILENILASVKVLAEKLPGKWENVCGAYLKTSKSKAIPIYVSFGNPNDIKLEKARKKEKVARDELSTMLDTEVRVFRDGSIIVKKMKPDSENKLKTKNIENAELCTGDDAQNTRKEVHGMEEATVPQMEGVDMEESNDPNPNIKSRKRKSKKRKTSDVADSGEFKVENSAQEEVVDIEESDDHKPNVKSRKRKSSDVADSVEFKVGSSAQEEGAVIEDSDDHKLGVKSRKRKSKKRKSSDVADSVEVKVVSSEQEEYHTIQKQKVKGKRSKGDIINEDIGEEVKAESNVDEKINLRKLKHKRNESFIENEEINNAAELNKKTKLKSKNDCTADIIEKPGLKSKKSVKALKNINKKAEDNIVKRNLRKRSALGKVV